MSMYPLQNMMRQEALKAISSLQFVSLGKITGYDPVNYLATVSLYEADSDTPNLQTGWLPIFSPWVGNGFGMFAPPNIGDIVEVHWQEGSLQNGYIALRSYTQVSPPQAVNSGEFWLVHQSGSSVKLTNDGKVLINGKVEIDITAPKISINVTGDVEVSATKVAINSGDIELGDSANSLSALLNATAASVYNSHTHPDPQGGDTSAPTQQMTGTSLTTNVKAN